MCKCGDYGKCQFKGSGNSTLCFEGNGGSLSVIPPSTSHLGGGTAFHPRVTQFSRVQQCRNGAGARTGALRNNWHDRPCRAHTMSDPGGLFSLSGCTSSLHTKQPALRSAHLQAAPVCQPPARRGTAPSCCLTATGTDGKAEANQTALLCRKGTGNALSARGQCIPTAWPIRPRGCKFCCMHLCYQIEFRRRDQKTDNQASLPSQSCSSRT